MYIHAYSYRAHVITGCIGGVVGFHEYALRFIYVTCMYGTVASEFQIHSKDLILATCVPPGPFLKATHKKPLSLSCKIRSYRLSVLFLHDSSRNQSYYTRSRTFNGASTHVRAHTRACAHTRARTCTLTHTHVRRSARVA